MFASGVRFYTSIAFLIRTAVVVACVIFIPGLYLVYIKIIPRYLGVALSGSNIHEC